MDSLCEKLETLTSQLSRSLEAMHRSPRAGSIASPNEDLTTAAQVLNSLPNIQESVAGLQSFPDVHDTGTNLDGNMHPNRAEAPLRGRQVHVNKELHGLSSSEDSDTSDDEHQERNAEERQDEQLGQAGALVRDPYGRLR